MIAVWASGVSIALTTTLGSVSHAQDEPGPAAGLAITVDSVGLAHQGHEQSLDGNATGYEVLTWGTHQGPLQQWENTNWVADTFMLENQAHKGECVTAPAELGKPLTMAACNKTSVLQRWSEANADGVTVFRLAADHNRVMQATDRNSPVILAAEDRGNPMQQWSVESVA